MAFLRTGRERERREEFKLMTEMEPPLTRFIQSSIVPFLPLVSPSLWNQRLSSENPAS